MNRVITPAAAAIWVLLVSGCVTAPKAELHGVLPDRGTFYLSKAEPKSPVAERLVRDRLTAQGLTENGEGIYLVQASLAERSASSGMAVSTVPSHWLHAPVRGSGRVVQFSLTLTRAADGTEVFRAAAAKRGARIDEKATRQLVDAVFAPVRRETTAMRAAKRR